MRKTYRILADIIAVLVVTQAALMVWAIAGLFSWIDKDGGALDKSVIEGWDQEPPTFDGAIGAPLHFMIGGMLIPALGIIFLIVAIFAKVPRGVVYAAIVVALIAVQYLAGMYAESAGATLGILHGLNAFILFGAALTAAKAARPQDAPQEMQPAAM